MARGDEGTEATEQVAQREYNQSGSDRLRANHVPHFADAARGTARGMLHLIRRPLNSAGDPLLCCPD